MGSSKSSDLDPLLMLFKAKWNVPRAAEALNCPVEECKEQFEAYCAEKWAQNSV